MMSLSEGQCTVVRSCQSPPRKGEPLGFSLFERMSVGRQVVLPMNPGEPEATWSRWLKCFPFRERATLDEPRSGSQAAAP